MDRFELYRYVRLAVEAPATAVAHDWRVVGEESPLRSKWRGARILIC
jgi:hypothetical protein